MLTFFSSASVAKSSSRDISACAVPPRERNETQNNEHDYVFVESLRVASHHDDFEIVDHEPDDGDGFEEVAIADGQVRSVQQNAEKQNAASVAKSESAGDRDAYHPAENAFAPKRLARATSLPVRNMPTAPLAAQVGLRTGPCKPRAMTMPGTFPDGTESPID